MVKILYTEHTFLIVIVYHDVGYYSIDSKRVIIRLVWLAQINVYPSTTKEENNKLR
jgi:hypothetical protein